jgi:urease accessory protein
LGGRAVSSYQLALQQLVDSALPTGAFAHSLGFETYVDAGVVADEAGFGRWLAAFVSQQLTYSDGLVIRFLYEGADVLELDALLSASLLPRQVREASVKMGLRLLEIGVEVFPSPALGLYRDLVATGRVARAWLRRRAQATVDDFPQHDQVAHRALALRHAGGGDRRAR